MGRSMTPMDEDPSVLGNLPRTRPQRRSGRRAGEAATGRPSSAPPPQGPARAKPSPQGPARERAERVSPKPFPHPTPQPSTARAARDRDAPGDIVADAIAAAGEVSKLGLTLGVKVLRGAVARLPRPR